MAITMPTGPTEPQMRPIPTVLVVNTVSPGLVVLETMLEAHAKAPFPTCLRCLPSQRVNQALIEGTATFNHYRSARQTKRVGRTLLPATISEPGNSLIWSLGPSPTGPASLLRPRATKSGSPRLSR